MLGLVALAVALPLITATSLLFIWWSFPVLTSALPASWHMPAFIAISSLASIGWVLLLLLGVRGRKECRASILSWFSPGRAARLGLGFALTIPILGGVILSHGIGQVRLIDSESLPSLLGSVALTPVAEEVLFRGFVFGLLWREVRLKPWPALLLSSLVFGAGHINWLESPLTLQDAGMALLHAAQGALLCWACWKSAGDLCLPIGFHAGMNLWASIPLLPAHGLRDQVLVYRWSAQILALGAAYLILRAIESRGSLPGVFPPASLHPPEPVPAPSGSNPPSPDL